MVTPNESLSTSILAIMYFGAVVFAVSGALTAARYRMDFLGFVLIGAVTGTGGGSTRDLLLGRTLWWTHEAIACSAAFALRACAIIFDIRTGPPGEFIRFGGHPSESSMKGTNDGSRT